MLVSQDGKRTMQILSLEERLQFEDTVGEEEWKHGAHGPIAAEDRKYREINDGVQLAFSFLLSPGPRSRRWFCPQLDGIFPPQLPHSRHPLTAVPRGLSPEQF